MGRGFLCMHDGDSGSLDMLSERDRAKMKMVHHVFLHQRELKSRVFSRKKVLRSRAMSSVKSHHLFKSQLE